MGIGKWESGIVSYELSIENGELENGNRELSVRNRQSKHGGRGLCRFGIVHRKRGIRVCQLEYGDQKMCFSKCKLEM